MILRDGRLRAARTPSVADRRPSGRLRSARRRSPPASSRSAPTCSCSPRSHGHRQRQSPPCGRRASSSRRRCRDAVSPRARRFRGSQGRYWSSPGSRCSRSNRRGHRDRATCSLGLRQPRMRRAAAATRDPPPGSTTGRPPAAVSTCSSMCSPVASASPLRPCDQRVEELEPLLVRSEHLRLDVERLERRDLVRDGECGSRPCMRCAPCEVRRRRRRHSGGTRPSRRRTPRGSGSRSCGRCSRSTRGRPTVAWSRRGCVGSTIVGECAARGLEQPRLVLAQHARLRRSVAHGAPCSSATRLSSRIRSSSRTDRPVGLRVRLRDDRVDQLVGQLRDVRQLRPRPLQRRPELREEVAHAVLAAGDAVRQERPHLRPAQPRPVADRVVDLARPSRRRRATSQSASRHSASSSRSATKPSISRRDAERLHAERARRTPTARSTRLRSRSLSRRRPRRAAAGRRG